MEIEGKKLSIISKIMEISDESVIDQVNEFIKNNPMESNDRILKKLNKPIKPKLDLEEIKLEQHFKEIDKEEINKLIQEADIKDPIEDLLQMD